MEPFRLLDKAEAFSLDSEFSRSLIYNRLADALQWASKQYGTPGPEVIWIETMNHTHMFLNITRPDRQLDGFLQMLAERYAQLSDAQQMAWLVFFSITYRTLPFYDKYYELITKAALFCKDFPLNDELLRRIGESEANEIKRGFSIDMANYQLEEIASIIPDQNITKSAQLEVVTKWTDKILICTVDTIEAHLGTFRALRENYGNLFDSQIKRLENALAVKSIGNGSLTIETNNAPINIGKQNNFEPGSQNIEYAALPENPPTKSLKQK